MCPCVGMESAIARGKEFNGTDIVDMMLFPGVYTGIDNSNLTVSYSMNIR